MTIWEYFEEKYGFTPQDFITEDDIDEVEDEQDLESLQSIAALRAFAEIAKSEPVPSDEDFEVNPTQMKKFLDIVEYFLDLCAKRNGTMNKIQLVPHKKSGKITAFLPSVDFDEREIRKFCETLSPCFALDIGPQLDTSICVSLSVLDVFVKKA